MNRSYSLSFGQSYSLSVLVRRVRKQRLLVLLLGLWPWQVGEGEKSTVAALLAADREES